MYQREFDQRLKQAFPKAVLFYGENDYLVDFYIDTYIKKTDAKESMLSLYHDEWNFEQAKNFLSQTSLFGGTNLLVIKYGKKIPKKELDILVSLANKNADNYFIMTFDPNPKDLKAPQNIKAMQSSFTEKKGGVWVRFFEPNIRDGIAVLQQKAQKIHLDIDHYALQHLMVVLNNNLALCSNELDKLAILGMKVTSKDIDRLVYSTSPLATEHLLIGLFNKRPITEMIAKLLELGENEAEILKATQIFVNQIFLFHAYIKLHGHVDSAAILGYKLPKQIEEQKAQLALRVKSVSLLKIFEHLLESELAIKKAKGPQKEVLLYSMLIKLQGYL
jgi:DNA polymerase-3 subunit delta